VIQSPQTINQQHMSKSQNKKMVNKRRQGNMTPQKVNNHILEDLVAN
jgi:hypothetical protein